ncbi:hypothetical protein NDU88_010525 [Pleurodeles waltl]|uniref:Uncharacterized protein n=1 Tax=Pleurodeles waltl TaxID=8319 RepID=A0AAV7QUP2_PLEWA|nr:hypothetical protein NDU88_010525 [Pleurodeles waltl]
MKVQGALGKINKTCSEIGAPVSAVKEHTEVMEKDVGGLQVLEPYKETDHLQEAKCLSAKTYHAWLQKKRIPENEGEERETKARRTEKKNKGEERERPEAKKTEKENTGDDEMGGAIRRIPPLREEKAKTPTTPQEGCCLTRYGAAFAVEFWVVN